MKFPRAVYGTASLMLALIMLNSTNLTAQAQLLPLPPPIPTFLANDDSATTDEDNPATVNVLANDLGSETGLFFVRSVTQPSNGVAEIISDSTIRYTPNPNFFGLDSFQYTASDATGLTQSTATVSITINPINDPPVANDDFASTNEDTSVSINVLINDSDVDDDELAVASVTKPIHGVVVINNDNTVTYTPVANYFGADTFNYTVSDGNGGTDTATVFMTVSPVNDPPVANDDSAVTDEDTSTSINVLSNDSDVDGDTLAVTSVTKPGNGTSELFSTGFVIYTPNRDFTGNDSFTYTISDGNGGTATATVQVTVNPVRDFAINKISSGLVASDSLTQPKTKEQLRADSYWTFGGSATGQNATVDFFQDAQGLHIGVQAVSNGTYAGFYALTPSTNATLFHAVMTTPFRTTPSHFFQNGLYVQTDNGLINYVTCVSITGAAGTTWHVIHATGDVNQTHNTTVLWSDPSPNQPLTKDCTIITNGTNYLKVYLDGVRVYESSQLDLKMPPPFLYFLEPQSNYAAQLLYGIYKDFYITSDESITVNVALSTAATVDVVDSSNNVLASAPVVNGKAIINVGQYHFPLAAHIKVYDSSHVEIVSTAAPASIAGGDVYSVDQTS